MKASRIATEKDVATTKTLLYSAEVKNGLIEKRLKEKCKKLEETANALKRAQESLKQSKEEFRELHDAYIKMQVEHENESDRESLVEVKLNSHTSDTPRGRIQSISAVSRARAQARKQSPKKRRTFKVNSPRHSDRSSPNSRNNSLSRRHGKRKKGLSQRFDLKRCTCGYAAYELSKYSPGYGLFPEDEVSLAPTDKGRPSTMAVVRRPSSHREIKTEGSSSSTASAPVTGLEPLFTNLVEIIVDQCSSPFSCSVLRYQMLSLGLGKNTGTHGKDSCGSGVSSVVSVGVLHGLRPLIQEALQKSTSRKTWEQPNGTVVQGPLSWKQLHNVAVKGVEESPKPQPIPSMRVGCGGDWMSLSPFAFQFWDKLLLEPFSAARDVAYVVVAPENESVISSTKLFFRELSSIYETCRLGQHVPISKLRDGILRVGQKFLKLSKESVDDWFTQQSTTVEGARLKLYAQVCRYQLAPYLSTLTLDRHLLDRDEKTSNSKLDTERSGFPYSGSEGSKTGT
ncbi:predicted protein, partial [Nematostella vectensis]